MSRIPPTSRHRVYCAGPLFNQAERSEMTTIAEHLNDAGFPVYLPHRDGMEFRLVHEVLVEHGWDAPTAAHFLHASIFALDIYQLIVECDSVVWNLNGRTPDEGAVSEAAITWALGKPLVAYSDDARTLIAGRVNPLLVGLVDFETIDTIANIAPALFRAIAQTDHGPIATGMLSPRIRRAVADGERLWTAMSLADAQCDNGAIADLVEELFGPRHAEGNGRAHSPVRRDAVRPVSG